MPPSTSALTVRRHVRLLDAESLHLLVAIVFVALSAWVPAAGDHPHIWSLTAEISGFLGRNYNATFILRKLIPTTTTNIIYVTVWFFYMMRTCTSITIFLSPDKTCRSYWDKQNKWLTAHIVGDIIWLAYGHCAAEWMKVPKCFWDFQVLHSYRFDPGSNAGQRQLLIIEGDAGNCVSSRGNAAEHGCASLSQHLLVGVDLGHVLRRESCMWQREAQRSWRICLVVCVM